METSLAPTFPEFSAAVEAFLSGHAEPRRPQEQGWGIGSDVVAALAEKSAQEQTEQLRRAREWKAVEFDAGFGWLSGPVRWGGAGLDVEYERAYLRARARYRVPSQDPFRVGMGMVAPTIEALATDELRGRYLRCLHRGEIIACQLFSEPSAGSDLANVRTRAVSDGAYWVVDGQKIWTSGAHYSDIGLLLCRSDPAAPKHKGMTAFLVDMHAPGVDVRPLRQMTGGASFNEVFLTGVRIPDSHRIGASGEGWRVAVATLGNERASMGGLVVDGDTIDHAARLTELARHLDRHRDPVIRQAIAEIHIRTAAARYAQMRTAAAVAQGRTPGAEASIGKLVLADNYRRIADVATLLLGDRITADTGEWGTFAWSQFVLGAPGSAIGGGTDQIMRNVLGERVLGLPKEPR